MPDIIDSSLPIAVVGAGTMGAGIALVAAQAGHPVALFDSFPGAIEKARKSHAGFFSKAIEKGKSTPEAAKAIQDRIQYLDRLDALSSAQLVIEAIIEDVAAKQDLFRRLETIVSADAILASNTSSLSITSIAAACSRPERCVGIHFFNPAPLMPLVEVVPGVQTAKHALDRSVATISAWGKSTVVAKDTPGFIVNRVARSFYGESIRIFEERWMDLPDGAAGMATIDWALREQGGFRMGPFELMDLIGNDINYTVTETVWKQFYQDPRYRPSLTQKRMVEAGRFGRKSGMGYYDYQEGAVLPEPDRDPVRAERIFKRVISMLVNEAADALYLQVASAADIDLAMTKGVNYPKGLLQWCDELGAASIVEELHQLYEEYQDDRYRCSVLLRRTAREGLRFRS
ncbi:MAG: 3-hydroxyacyl-CoA dehydrogenase NAD-binding domain-containing protein [Bacteroidota bacterium]